MTISLRAARSLIVGDVSLQGNPLVTAGTTATYGITDFNSFSVYSVSSNIGTASITDQTITLNVPSGTTAPQVTLTVLRDGRPSYFTVAVGAQSIVTPTITSPTTGQQQVSVTPTITASAFATAPLGGDTQLSASWQVARDAGFSDLVLNVVNDTVNKQSYSVAAGILAINTSYYARVRYTGAALGQSAWSPVVTFATRSQYVGTPVVTVEGGPDSVGEIPKISGGPFTVLGGGTDSHASTDWQIVKISDGSVVYSSLGNSVSKTTLNLPAGILQTGTAYKARVRYAGAALGAGGWGEYNFNTLVVFSLGQYFAANLGGFGSTGLSAEVYGFDINTPISLLKIQQYNTGITAQSFSPDGRYYAVGVPNSNTSAIGRVDIYKRNGDAFTLLTTIENGQYKINALEFSPDSSRLFIAPEVNTPVIFVYSVANDNFIKQPNFQAPGFDPTATQRVLSIDFSPNGVRLALTLSSVEFDSSAIRTYEHANNVYSSPVTFSDSYMRAFYSSLRWNADGTKIVFCGTGGRLYVLRHTGTALVTEFNGNPGGYTLTDACFDKTGQWLVVNRGPTLYGETTAGTSLFQFVSGSWVVQRYLAINVAGNGCCVFNSRNQLVANIGNAGQSTQLFNFNTTDGSTSVVANIAANSAGFPPARCWPEV